MLQGKGIGTDQKNFVSWESRYVGDVRAINAGILDAYLLKSLDGGLPFAYWDGLLMVPCGENSAKRCLFQKGKRTLHKATGEMVDTAVIGRYSPTDTWAVDIVKRLERVRVELDFGGGGGGGDGDASSARDPRASGESDIEVGISGATVEEGGIPLVNGELRSDAKWFAVAASALDHPLVVDLLAEFARRSGDPHPMQYDVVIRCLGWKHNTSIYSASARPRMQSTLKYPVMTSEYESVNVPGLYFARKHTIAEPQFTTPKHQSQFLSSTQRIVTHSRIVTTFENCYQHIFHAYIDWI